MRLFHKHVKAGRSYLADSAGHYHQYDDCVAINGKTKHIYGATFLKYRLCSTCSQRSSNIVYENAADLRNNEKKYMAELVANVGKLDKTDDEKIDLAKRGLLYIRMQTLIWSALEDITRRNSD